MGYRFLEGLSLELGEHRIVSLRQDDVYLIKKWRNEQISVLRQKKMLSDEDQKWYYTNVVLPTFEQEQPPMLLVSYLYGEDCIGYGGLVYIDWESLRAEVSFLLETERTQKPDVYSSEFATFLTLLKQLAFRHLPLHRLFTETFEGRELHESVLEKNGFKKEGCLREHVFKEGVFKNSHLHGILKSDVIFKE